MKKKNRNRIGLKIISFLLVTLLCIAAVLVGVVYVLEKGPSPTITGIFCRSVRETSAIRWISEMFLTDEELEPYKTVSTESTETSDVNTSLIKVAEIKDESESDGVELIDISSGTCKGKMLIVSNPKRVILGTSDNLGRQAGMQLTDIVSKYNGIAGINAGGFNDEGGRGNGGIPQGLVIANGEIAYDQQTSVYNVVGLDGDGILIVGTMSAAQAIEKGVKWGVSFVTHDGVASSLIINGEVQTQNIGSGVNPRTAIGQRADGAILLLVLDGRSVSTLGATMQNVVDIMLEYGAVNAGNLDGGSSSVMVYDGEIINNCASVTGPRQIPTAFIVTGKDAE